MYISIARFYDDGERRANTTAQRIGKWRRKKKQNIQTKKVDEQKNQKKDINLVYN